MSEELDLLLYGVCFHRLLPDGSVTYVPADEVLLSGEEEADRRPPPKARGEGGMNLIRYCPKHGDAEHREYACLECIREVYPTPIPPDQRKAEEAVIRAAEDVVAKDREYGSIRYVPGDKSSGISLAHVPRGSFEALVESCRGLHRLRNKPQPVKPEEVEPGTRFRFAAPKAARFEDRTLRRVEIYDPERDERTPAWLIEEIGSVSRFLASDRIIPEQD